MSDVHSTMTDAPARMPPPAKYEGEADAAYQQRVANYYASTEQRRASPGDDPTIPRKLGEGDVEYAARVKAASKDDPAIPRDPGESDADYKERVKLAKEADARAKKLADAQAKAAKDGTTAHPSGLPAAAAFASRIEAAKFTLRNHGYDEVTSLIDDLYAGVQRVEATASGVKPVIATGAPQQPGESDADYAKRVPAAQRV